MNESSYDVPGGPGRLGRMSQLGAAIPHVAHELNNLGAAWMGAAQFIRERADSGLPPEREDLDAIDAIGERLVTLGRELARVSRSPREALTGLLARDALVRTVACLQTLGVGKHTTVRIEAAADVRVAVSEWLFSHVVLTLLSNAAYAASLSHSSEVVVTCVANYDLVTLCVSDSGLGLHEEVRSKVVREPVSTLPKDRGAGSGLFLLSAALSEVGAEIRVESSAEGTRVYVDFRAG